MCPRRIDWSLHVALARRPPLDEKVLTLRGFIDFSRPDAASGEIPEKDRFGRQKADDTVPAIEGPGTTTASFTQIGRHWR